MRKLKLLGFIFSALMVSQSYAIAADHASCDEAKAMVEKAVSYYKANGAEKSWSHFMSKPADFWDRDLYVFAFDKEGTYKVHAAKPIMVGKNAIDLKDASGYSFIKAIVEVKGADWVSYKYPDPSDGNKVKDKKSFVQRVDDYIIGVGCYIQ